MEPKIKPISDEMLGNVYMRNRILFWGGVLGPLVYIFNVVIGGIITPNYSHIRNAVSELTQRGAAHIVVLSTLFVLSAILILVFGDATMLHYWHHSKRVYIAGALIVTYGVLAALMATVFPQDPLDGESTFAGTMHLVLAGVAALTIVGPYY